MLPCWRPSLSLQISYVSLRHLGIKILVHSKASEVKSKADSWWKNNVSQGEQGEQGELLKNVCWGEVHSRAKLNLLSEPTFITSFHCALHLIVTRRVAQGRL